MKIEQKVFQPPPVTTVVMEMDPEDMGTLLAVMRLAEKSWLPSWMHQRFDTIVGELAIMEEELSDDNDYDPSIGG